VSRDELTRLAKCMAFAAYKYSTTGLWNAYAAAKTPDELWCLGFRGKPAIRRRWLRAARLADKQTQRKEK
jgi:hypothetical protein